MRITFRKPLGRTYGSNALPFPSGPPQRDEGIRQAPPPRGGDTLSSVPASLRVIDARGRTGASPFTDNDRALNSGLPPQRIVRKTRALDRGSVQGGIGSGFAGTGPTSYDPKTDGGSVRIPHQIIPRKPITVTAFRRTIDSTSTIPARGIAAPLK
jgi:hypothetical protein